MPDQPRAVDVVVVGGGPAGMAAALAAKRRGRQVVLLDSAGDVGGQYWRHLPEERRGRREGLLHHGWTRFLRMRDELYAGCEVVTNAHVWHVERRDDRPPLLNVLIGEPDGQDREARVYDPATLVLATGAHERTLPFPGWDLPGVFTAGAAQALAKGERVAVGRRVLVAGAGPFLLPVVSSLVRTGAQVVGVLEAAGWAQMARGWGNKPWQAGSKAFELAGYVRDLARHRITYRTGSAVVAAHGNGRVRAVTVARLRPDWSPVPGTEKRVAVDAVCVSHGFVPRTELAVAAGCALDPDGSVRVDSHLRTSVPGVFCAGEVTGIAGAAVALAEGTAAGEGSAKTPDGFAQKLATAHGIRPGWRGWLTDDTTVCRCEDVTAGKLREIAALTGTKGLRSLKLTTRAGLGLCQGRTCGKTIEDLIPDLTDKGRTANRPIATPIRLGELAGQAAREDAP